MSVVIGTCLGQCISFGACTLLSSKCEMSYQAARYFYVGIFVIFSCITYLLQHYGQSIIITAPWYVPVSEFVIYDYVSEQSVFRVSSVLSMFYFVMALFTCQHGQNSECSYRCFTSGWFMKLFTLFILTACNLIWTPVNVITEYEKVCVVGSALFLIAQVIILIDFAYTLNESLFEEGAMTSSGTMNKGLLIAFATAHYIGSLTLIIIMYIRHVEYSALITCTLLYQCIQIPLSISSYIEHGTIITSSVVSLYITYLCYSSIQIDGPDSKNGAGQTPFQNLMSALFMLGSLAFAAHSTSKTNIFHTRQSIPEYQLSEYSNEVKNVEEGCVENGITHRKSTRILHRDSPYFHLMMSCCSMYMAMLFTDWGNYSTNFFTKVICQWLCSGLYLWTLVAPKILVSRDFS